MDIAQPEISAFPKVEHMKLERDEGDVNEVHVEIQSAFLVVK